MNHVEVGLISDRTDKNEMMDGKNMQNPKKTLKIQTNVKAGGFTVNHVEVGLRAN